MNVNANSPSSRSAYMLIESSTQSGSTAQIAEASNMLGREMIPVYPPRAALDHKIRQHTQKVINHLNTATRAIKKDTPDCPESDQQILTSLARRIIDGIDVPNRINLFFPVEQSDEISNWMQWSIQLNKKHNQEIEYPPKAKREFIDWFNSFRVIKCKFLDPRGVISILKKDYIIIPDSHAVNIDRILYYLLLNNVLGLALFLLHKSDLVNPDFINTTFNEGLDFYKQDLNIVQPAELKNGIFDAVQAVSQQKEATLQAREAELQAAYQQREAELKAAYQQKEAGLEAAYQQKEAGLEATYQQKEAGLEAAYQQKEAGLEAAYQQKGAELQNEYKRCQCSICMNSNAEITFQPCGHLTCCRSCSTSLPTCPTCRANINTRIRTYQC